MKKIKLTMKNDLDEIVEIIEPVKLSVAATLLHVLYEHKASNAKFINACVVDEANYMQ